MIFQVHPWSSTASLSRRTRKGKAILSHHFFQWSSTFQVVYFLGVYGWKTHRSFWDFCWHAQFFGLEPVQICCIWTFHVYPCLSMFANALPWCDWFLAQVQLGVLSWGEFPVITQVVFVKQEPIKQRLAVETQSHILDAWNIYLSNEKKPWLFRLYRGLYYITQLYGDFHKPI